jgi:phosphate starvation-inducible PhoH-like protein
VTEVASATRRVIIPPDLNLLALLGRNDEHLKMLETQYDVKATSRGYDVTLRGEEGRLQQAEKVVRDLIDMLRARPSLGASDIRSALRIAGAEPDTDLKGFLADSISVPSRRKLISPKTANQKRYLDAVRSHDLVIAIGPAGTGKSYLAVAMAVAALVKREVSRIILTRPAVEAGERLGFLPGDLIEKFHPYLRPLYDALYDMLEAEKVANLSEKGAIEIAPLAYMRGRTLNDAFIILDEAQNTTSEQMSVPLTRLGFNSKMVITGDVTQVDLPASRPRLIEIQHVLRHRGHTVRLLRPSRRGPPRSVSAIVRPTIVPSWPSLRRLHPSPSRLSFAIRPSLRAPSPFAPSPFAPSPYPLPGGERKGFPPGRLMPVVVSNLQGRVRVPRARRPPRPPFARWGGLTVSST